MRFLLLLALFSTSALAGVETMTREYPLTISDIHDADTLKGTIDLGFGLTMAVCVRFYGLDAPELATPAGKASKAALVGFLKGKKAFVLRTNSTPDKYGRTLGIIVADSINVNDWLLTNKYAVPYFGGTKEPQ